VERWPLKKIFFLVFEPRLAAGGRYSDGSHCP
jgi:hypothetical protein